MLCMIRKNIDKRKNRVSNTNSIWLIHLFVSLSAAFRFCKSIVQWIQKRPALQHMNDEMTGWSGVKFQSSSIFKVCEDLTNKALHPFNITLRLFMSLNFRFMREIMCDYWSCHRECANLSSSIRSRVLFINEYWQGENQIMRNEKKSAKYFKRMRLSFKRTIKHIVDLRRLFWCLNDWLVDFWHRWDCHNHKLADFCEREYFCMWEICNQFKYWL